MYQEVFSYKKGGKTVALSHSAIIADADGIFNENSQVLLGEPVGRLFFWDSIAFDYLLTPIRKLKETYEEVLEDAFLVSLNGVDGLLFKISIDEEWMEDIRKDSETVFEAMTDLVYRGFSYDDLPEGCTVLLLKNTNPDGHELCFFFPEKICTKVPAFWEFYHVFAAEIFKKIPNIADCIEICRGQKEDKERAKRDTFLLLNDPAACALIDINEDGNVYLRRTLNPDATEGLQCESYDARWSLDRDEAPTFFREKGFWDVWSNRNGEIVGGIMLYDGLNQEDARQMITNGDEAPLVVCPTNEAAAKAVESLPAGMYLFYVSFAH